jgi:hypothetical protein
VGRRSGDLRLQWAALVEELLTGLLSVSLLIVLLYMLLKYPLAHSIEEETIGGVLTGEGRIVEVIAFYVSASHQTNSFR